MAAVQTLHTMTLGRQQTPATKMYNVIHHSPTTQNCVIVSTGLQQPMSNAKSVIQTKRPLAPAPDKNTSILVNNNNNNNNNHNTTNNNADVLRCKRKINFVPYGGPGHQPASVARRNARERNRVKQVNNGFATLRQHIPASVAAALAVPGNSAPAAVSRGASKKLSKVETLRMAVEYIRSLQRMLEEYETETGGTASGSEVLNARYYTASPDVNTHLGHQLAAAVGHQVLTQQTPPCSEASSSPTPSFSSESSVSANSSYATTALYHTENYENYEPNSPEDEDLLDAISWWQQQ